MALIADMNGIMFIHEICIHTHIKTTKFPKIVGLQFRLFTTYVFA